MMPSSRELQRRYGLTPREADVALEIVGGGQNRDVADRLGLSLHTVRRHVERVLFKLQVHSRSSVLPTLLSDSARRSAS